MRLIHALAALSLLFETPRAEDNHEGAIQRHNAEIEADLLRDDKPIRGVRKMSSDEGEKFFLDYWSYDGSDGLSMGNHTGTDNDVTDDNIQPRSYPFQPASIKQARGISLLQRDFQCPAGTTGCTSINRPSSCCTTGDICELVQDTGSGDVGCCPQGQTCSGVIGSCQSGYTACPAKLGGGCCIPGYECVSGGCAYVSTVTVTVHSTVFVSTKTYTTPPSSYIPSSTSTGTSKTSSDDLVPPARPTSLSTATTSKSSSETGSICPIGFYACSAVYQGGCCRTGRDCDTTSCPTISSTAVVSNNDETIVAPAVSTGSASCASGWFGCDESMGGGCCPTGFTCGSASCTASTGGSVTATGTVAKETGGGSGRSLDGRILLIVLAIMVLV